MNKAKYYSNSNWANRSSWQFATFVEKSQLKPTTLIKWKTQNSSTPQSPSQYGWLISICFLISDNCISGDHFSSCWLRPYSCKHCLDSTLLSPCCKSPQLAGCNAAFNNGGMCHFEFEMFSVVFTPSADQIPNLFALNSFCSERKKPTSKDSPESAGTGEKIGTV